MSALDLIDDLGSFDDDPAVEVMSLMDYIPGERPFASIEQAAIYYQGTQGLSDKQLHTFVTDRSRNSKRYAQTHRDTIATRYRERGIRLAGHDDANAAPVDEAVGYGVGSAEFPTTREAATQARTQGLSIRMGAPNVVLAVWRAGRRVA